MTRSDKIRAAERFSASEHSSTIAKLLDGTEFPIPLDTRASKPVTSKNII